MQTLPLYLIQSKDSSEHKRIFLAIFLQCKLNFSKGFLALSWQKSPEFDVREAEEGRVSRFDMRRRATLPPFTFLVSGWVVFMVVRVIRARVKEKKHQVRINVKQSCSDQHYRRYTYTISDQFLSGWRQRKWSSFLWRKSRCLEVPSSYVDFNILPNSEQGFQWV